MPGSIMSPRNINFIKSWMKTGVSFSAAGGLAFLYFTDWKLFLQYVPIYNTKFKEQEE